MFKRKTETGGHPILNRIPAEAVFIAIAIACIGGPAAFGAWLGTTPLAPWLTGLLGAAVGVVRLILLLTDD